MKFSASQLRFEDLHYSLSDGYVATRLLFRQICNLPELNIRIFNPLTFYFSYKRHIPTRLMCRQICNLPELNIRIFQSAYFHCADGYVSTKLMCRLICNLPELNIRIFNPLASYFFINRYEFRITDPYTLCCRIAYPTEHYSCCFSMLSNFSLRSTTRAYPPEQ